MGIKVWHCPTLKMIGDLFTKPLQGSLFRQFRDIILGYDHADSLYDDSSTQDEERVGKDATLPRNQERTRENDERRTNKEKNAGATQPKKANSTGVNRADVVVMGKTGQKDPE
jgi:hypothetical protein